jgi:hypothetical protein
MKNYKPENNALNPSGERFHIEAITVSTGAAVSIPERIYWPHLPILETGQIVGLLALSAFAGPSGNPSNISPNTVNPAPSFNVSSFNYLQNLFVTLVNKNGETLFDRIPYSTLFPFNGKIKKYNAVNLDTRKCFFSFASGTIISGQITAQIGFILNYQN